MPTCCCAVGTGKTEFAKALAAKTSCKIWSIGEADDDGNGPTRCERIAELKLALRLLARHRRAVILFDQAEDALAGVRPRLGRQRGESKVFVNRLIETNRVPVIWTCNDVQDIDRAVLRRMTLAREIRTPGPPVRERIWGRLLSGYAVSVEEGAAARLAGRHAAPPAVAANAARAAALSSDGEAEIELAMSGVLPLLGIAPQPTTSRGAAFDPALVYCATNLAALAGWLTRPRVAAELVAVHPLAVRPGKIKVHAAPRRTARSRQGPGITRMSSPPRSR